MATLSVGGTTVFDGAELQSGVTGSPVLTLPSTTTFPPHHIIQTVMSTPFSGTESTSSSSTSGVNTSVYSVITPLKSSSDILIFGSLDVGVNNGGAYGGNVWMTRSQAGGEADTKVIVGDTSGSRIRATGGVYSDSNDYQHFIIPTCYLDSPTIPSTPVAITYRWVFRSGWNGYSILINHAGADPDTAAASRCMSYITLMEVAR